MKFYVTVRTMIEKILIADDEQRLVDLISDFLVNAGYETVKTYDGEEALAAFNDTISLCIVDIMMPGMDGWKLTREIRKKSAVPIIMLSARSEDFDQLTGFEAGIDEYVTKPFSPAVLVKRVEALLRRSSPAMNTEKTGLYLDKAAFCAYLDGKLLTLTLKEFELLSHLNENLGRVLSRDQLLNAVWGWDFEGEERTVDSHIARLRTKLGEYGAAHLKTVYGVGYKLD